MKLKRFPFFGFERIVRHSVMLGNAAGRKLIRM